MRASTVLRVIAIDGKSMRGARRDGVAPQLVAALDQASGAVLGQLAVAATSNEIPALRDLLDGIDITGAVITADALHCQRETATHITDAGGHYLLTVKGARGPRVGPLPRRGSSRPDPPDPNRQRTQAHRGRVRDLLGADDRGPLRNTAISVHQLTGQPQIAAALRHHSRDTRRPNELLTTA